jgi:hypothetical protein
MKIKAFTSIRPHGKTQFLYMALNQLNCRQKDSQNDISWRTFLPPERRQNLKE